MSSELVSKYFRADMLPHIWCPGCGNGIIVRDIAAAVDQLGLNRDKTVIVSGIGCSGRAAGYLDFCTLHTTHGRAIPFATGVKMADPELNVIVISGDGDASAIGGNHLIHGARRNIDLTVIIVNNSIYGMTGGQYSPLSPTGTYAATAPYGSLDACFDIPALVRAAGATYIARTTAYHTKQAVSLIKKGIEHKGFSVIECISQCPTYYGRKNKKGGGAEMMKWQRDAAVSVERAASMSPEELEGRIVTGLFYEAQRPECCELVRQLAAKQKKDQ